ncbi:class II aldolase/adducin family protein [Dehalobacterium formicoaceticum]|uniref:Class II aldolase/adducin family protein n=1 Tax=Dehalobacterium formicoaceticum TaxID=51515 RepID=A0ABT1Y200_9FIRM|nr:class II aldolase/adducin family protein [Dehalobacterium formicoaceticum]
MIIHSAVQLKDQIIQVGKKLVDAQLVVGTWGNISCRVPNHKNYHITPSGMIYHQLKSEDIVTMNFAGEVVEGDRKPSSEFILHQEIYKARSDVGAIVHTHSNYACSFAVAQERIPPVLEEAAQLIGGPVEVARYAPPGSLKLAIHGVRALENRNAVLLANHGVVAVGRSLEEAFTVAVLVEKLAQVFLNAKSLGTAHVLNDVETKNLRESFLKHYGQSKK